MTRENGPKAIEMFDLYMKNYPADGKTADQMVAEFEAKKKADDARVADSLKKAGKKKK